MYKDMKELAKDLWTLAKSTQNVDLQAKALEMREQMNELIEASQEKDDRIKELEDQIAFRATLSHRDGVYWSEGDSIPFCPRCWEVNKMAIHLKVLENGYLVCPECEKDFEGPGGRRRNTQLLS